MVWLAGVDPPDVNATARLAGLTFSVGLATGAVTVIACCIAPVPPPKPFTAAAHTVAVVFAVTVGAVQVNVQDPVLLGEVCVISLFWTLVPVPAVKVPALATIQSVVPGTPTVSV
jgi:hypothetical protein